MQVILMQDVPHLGSLGDEVLVKDGFARNFLLPRGMAIKAGGKNAGEVEHHRSRLEQQRNEAIEKAQAESEKVGALELLIKAKVGASGKLFGSVTNRDVQAALSEHGYELDRRSVQLQAPIKSVGTFTATVKLHTNVKVDVTIKVEPIIETGPAAVPENGGDAAEGADAATAEDTAEGAEERAEQAEEGAAADAGSAEGAPEETAQSDAGAEAAPEEAAEAAEGQSQEDAGGGEAAQEEQAAAPAAEPEPGSEN